MLFIKQYSLAFKGIGFSSASLIYVVKNGVLVIISFNMVGYRFLRNTSNPLELEYIFETISQIS